MDEYSPQAEVCSLHYPKTRDSLLREFPWNFATKTILLSQIDQEIPGWQYAYQYPPNALWVRKVFDIGGIDAEIPNEYEIVSTGTEKYICCDIYQAYAKCTIKVVDANLFDPLFEEALTYKLALKLSMPLTNSSNKTQENMSKYQLAIANAKLAGAVEGGSKKNDKQRPHSARAYLVR
jgi:hypothetical protein